MVHSIAAVVVVDCVYSSWADTRKLLALFYNISNANACWNHFWNLWMVCNSMCNCHPKLHSLRADCLCWDWSCCLIRLVCALCKCPSAFFCWSGSSWANSLNNKYTSTRYLFLASCSFHSNWIRFRQSRISFTEEQQNSERGFVYWLASFLLL